MLTPPADAASFRWKLVVSALAFHLGIASCAHHTDAASGHTPPVEQQVQHLERAPQRHEPATVASPDGRSVVWSERRGKGLESTEHALMVARDGGPAKAIATAVNLGGLAWSPDGTRIAYSEGTVVHVVDADGGRPAVVYVGPGGPYPGACFNLTWHPDGRLSFIEIESSFDERLANPKRITIHLKPAP